jgi:hypothetical protein
VDLADELPIAGVAKVGSGSDDVLGRAATLREGIKDDLPASPSLAFGVTDGGETAIGRDGSGSCDEDLIPYADSPAEADGRLIRAARRDVLPNGD